MLKNDKQILAGVLLDSHGQLEKPKKLEYIKRMRTILNVFGSLIIDRECSGKKYTWKDVIIQEDKRVNGFKIGYVKTFNQRVKVIGRNTAPVTGRRDRQVAAAKG